MRHLGLYEKRHEIELEFFLSVSVYLYSIQPGSTPQCPQSINLYFSIYRIPRMTTLKQDIRLEKALKSPQTIIFSALVRPQKVCIESQQNGKLILEFSNSVQKIALIFNTEKIASLITGNLFLLYTYIFLFVHYF